MSHDDGTPTGHTPLTTSQKRGRWWHQGVGGTVSHLKPRRKSTPSLKVSMVPISLPKPTVFTEAQLHCWDFIFDIDKRTIVE
mgnify:CR=1 FL=1